MATFLDSPVRAAIETNERLPLAVNADVRRARA
jgi:hypothetical protein